MMNEPEAAKTTPDPTGVAATPAAVPETPAAAAPAATTTTTAAAPLEFGGTPVAIADMDIDPKDLEGILASLKTANPNHLESLAGWAQRAAEHKAHAAELQKQVREYEQDKTKKLLSLVENAYAQIQKNNTEDESTAATEHSGHLKRVREELENDAYTSNGRCSSQALGASLELVAAAGKKIRRLEESMDRAKEMESGMEEQRLHQTEKRREAENAPHISKIMGAAGKTPFGSAAAGKAPAHDDGAARSPFFTEYDHRPGKGSVFDKIMEMGRSNSHIAPRPLGGGGGPSKV